MGRYLRSTPIGWSKKETLYDACGINPNEKQVIAVVGAGGKTTTIYQLANEFVGLGKRVIVTTTTHMFAPTSYGVFEESKEQVETMLANHRLAVVGVRALEDKIKGTSEAFMAWMSTACDVLFVEADGSKRLPIKMPNATEPVVPKQATQVLIVAGMSCLGRDIEECCHRVELTKPYLSTTTMTEQGVACLLQEGYIKQMTHPYRIVLNQCDTKEQLGQAKDIQQRLIEAGVSCESIVASTHMN